MELQSVGLRIETALETARQGGAGPTDSGMLWIEGVPVTVPPSSVLALRAARRGRRPGHLPGRQQDRLGGRHLPAPLLRPDHGRRRPLPPDRAAAPGLAGLHRGAGLQLLGQLRPVRVLRHRAVAGRRAHRRAQDPGDAGRGGGGRPRPGRRGGRHADHRLLGRPGPRRALRRPLRAGGEGGGRAAGRGAVRAAARPGGARAGARHGHRRGRHPRRVVRPAGAGPGGARQVPHRHRDLLPDLGARGRAVRRGPGVHLRDPGHGGGPGADRRGLPARGRHRRLPVRGAAAAGGRLADAGRAGAVAHLHRADLPQGRRVPGRPRAWTPAPRWPAAPAARPARRSTWCSTPAAADERPLLQIGAASGDDRVALPESVAVVNIGLPMFADAVRARAGRCSTSTGGSRPAATRPRCAR